MADYPAPSANLTVFNNSVYTSSDETLTLSEANSLYLKLTGGTETGLVTFSSGLNTSNIFTSGNCLVTGNLNVTSNINAYGTLHYLNGNVGIGTKAPRANLHVSGTFQADNFANVAINKTSGDPTNLGIHTFNQSTSSTAHSVLSARSSGANCFISLDNLNSGGWGIGLDSQDSNRLKFKPTYDFSGSTSYLTISRTNGYVGINTSSPQNTFHVYGSGQFDYGVSTSAGIQVPGSQGSYLCWNKSGGSAECNLISVQPSDSFTEAFRFQVQTITPTLSYTCAYLYKNGYLGLGTAPSYPLDINGQTTSSTYTNPSAGKYFSRNATITSLASTTTFNCSIHCTGSVWIDSSSGTSTDNSFVSGNSDRRIKENITEIDTFEALETIKKLKPVYYDYIDRFENGLQNIGYIAQEVLPVLPQAVDATQKKFIPNVFKFGKWYNNFINFDAPHGLKDKGKIQVILKKGGDEDKQEWGFIVKNELILEVSVSTDKSTVVFVYGTWVEDFHILAEKPISIMVVSAIKELEKRISRIERFLQLE